MTRSRTVALSLAALVVVAVSVAVVVMRSSRPTERGTIGGRAGTFVALGDSVAAGSACSCLPFPELVREAASTARGGDAYLLNAAAGGVTSADVLASVRDDDTAVATALPRATVVLLTVGANDFPEALAAGCDAALACYGSRVAAMQTAVGGTIARIAELSRARVVVTGYWSVFRDGAVADERGAAYVVTTRALTNRVNDALRAAATRSEEVV